MKPQSNINSIFLICAPSGAGKTSLVSALLEKQPNLRLSISHTTRPPRANENNGEHYYFTDQKTFELQIANDEFLEHANVYRNFYGTHKKTVLDLQKKGHDVLLEIDWQGAQQIRKKIHDCISIFILPPSLNTLKQRLLKRGQDSKEEIDRRLASAKQDIAHYEEFDYIVVNDNFEQAVSVLNSIIIANHYKQNIQKQTHQALLKSLLS